MNDTPVVPPVDFEDRRTGLMVFGILVIILGCMVALLVPITLLGQLVASRVPGTEAPPLRLMLPALFMYLGLAAAFIWLGIGSVQCRRWARALLLVLAWMWLVVGLVGLVAVGLIMPQVLAQPQPGIPPIPAAMRLVILLLMLAFGAVVYVIIPGALAFFYGSRHVKATCELRDPVPRWTDACPLPVLAICLLLGCGAAFLPLLMLGYHSVVPCFGRYLTGLPAMALLLLTMAVYVLGARACYRLRVAGWWIALLGYGLWMLSAVITFARLGLLPMYELMDVPEKQLALFKQMGFLQSPLLWVMMLVCWLPFLGFIIYTKRYFKR